MQQDRADCVHTKSQRHSLNHNWFGDTYNTPRHALSLMTYHTLSLMTCDMYSALLLSLWATSLAYSPMHSKHGLWIMRL